MLRMFLFHPTFNFVEIIFFICRQSPTVVLLESRTIVRRGKRVRFKKKSLLPYIYIILMKGIVYIIINTIK